MWPDTPSSRQSHTMWYTDAIYDGTKCGSSHIPLWGSPIWVFFPCSFIQSSVLRNLQIMAKCYRRKRTNRSIGTVKDADKKTLPKSWERIWSLVDYQVFVAFSRGLLSQNIQTGLVLTVKLWRERVPLEEVLAVPTKVGENIFSVEQ